MIFSILVLTIATFTNLAGTFMPDSSRVLGQSQFSLQNRYANTRINEVFKDNILLTLARMDNTVNHPQAISWENINKPRTYTLSLAPGELFAFHEDVLAEYKGKPIKTMKSHFNFSDGFKSSGALYGDGVCHLASLLYLAAKNAGLDTYAPTNHNFASIPELPKEYGVSIYFSPNHEAANARQNLYITNTKEIPILFIFKYDGSNLTVSITEQ
ncbi:VanW family protein [Candidatus Gottesmanbacteria bacterium]|nr:VanW family protein [Candidatus Gottesmanbacteria bacterium]